MESKSREIRKELFEKTKEVVSKLDVYPKIEGYNLYDKKIVERVEQEIVQDNTYDSSKIHFEQMDTISASIKYAKPYFVYPAVDFLVFASSKHYGGGVWTGAKAQEEDIFLCTDLFMLKEQVEKEYYPLKGILSVDCHIVSDANHNNLDQEIPARAFFAAAPNLNKEMNDPKLDVDFYSRMLCLTDATLDHSTETTLVIGAWGCGVFKNDPKEVAELFKTIMPLLLEDYKEVVVAIPDEKVLNIFKETLQYR